MYDIGTEITFSNVFAPRKADYSENPKFWKIPEALDEIYNSAISKQGLKPFSKNGILGFAGCMFYGFFGPEGLLSVEAYVFYTLQEENNINNEIKNIDHDKEHKQ